MKLIIATPCYGGMLTIQYFASMLRLGWMAQERKLPLQVMPAGNESLITRARNVLVHQFLKETDATHLMFIDADIGFKPDDVFAMLQTNHDVVAGAYPKKGIEWERVREAAIRQEKDLAPFGGDLAVNFIGPTATVERDCIEVLDAPTGFMMIKREVILKLIEAYPETLYQSDHPQTYEEPIHALFDCIIDQHRYLSEDYTFCRRWQKIGGKVHLYVPAELTHTGTFTFTGTPLHVMQPVEEKAA